MSELIARRINVLGIPITFQIFSENFFTLVFLNFIVLHFSDWSTKDGVARTFATDRMLLVDDTTERKRLIESAIFQHKSTD